ncbi:hypothetical protein Tco_1022688 [Tanacetum coccineum]
MTLLRDRPIIRTLEYAREYLMKRVVIVKQVIEKSDGLLTPTATKLFNVAKVEASEFISQYNRGHLYEVTSPWGKLTTLRWDCLKVGYILVTGLKHGDTFTITTSIPNIPMEKKNDGGEKTGNKSKQFAGGEKTVKKGKQTADVDKT